MNPSAPVVVVVDPDRHALAGTGHELEKRYGVDYEIVCESDVGAGFALLERLRDEEQALALLMVARAAGEEILARCRELHPTAKRALLVDPNERFDFEATAPLAHALAVGLVDGYLGRPMPPRELFHRSVVELLEEWAWAYGEWPKPVHVVGDPFDAKTHELRDGLVRGSVPHAFHPPDSPEARELLRSLDAGSERLPVVVVLGRALFDPTLGDVADAVAGDVAIADGGYDVVVVGAGPAGLGAAVYAASEGLRTLVVDRGPFGGQAGTSSMIRNYLGFPAGIAGEQLVRRAYTQAALFGAAFLFGREATELRPVASGHELELSDGRTARTRAVVLAAGVDWRRLGVASVEERVGAGIYYGAATTEAPGFTGEEVYVVGGGNSAGQAALHLARFAARVSLVVRGDSLERGMSQYLVRQLEAAPNVRVLLETLVVGAEGAGRLERLTLEDSRSARRETVPAAGLFLLLGAEPRTDWLPREIACDERGYVLTGPDVGEAARGDDRPTLLLETALRGVFAAGDVRHGSAKRVAAAVGEGALAIQLCHQFLAAAHPEVEPGRRRLPTGPQEAMRT